MLTHYVSYLRMLLKYHGKTALMMAAQGGHDETVNKLIAAGADVTLKVRSNGLCTKFFVNMLIIILCK